MDDNIKNVKQCNQIQEARSERKKNMPILFECLSITITYVDRTIG